MTASQEKKHRQLIVELALKYHYNEKHSSFVEDTSLKIFDSLKKIHMLGCTERALLSHAALLHDIGNFISEKKHNRHTKYIIDTDEKLEDYPEKEKALLSLIAYNHRKKLHKDIGIIPKKDREIVMKLSSILRVADSIDYCRDEMAVKSVSVDNSTLNITVEGILPERLSGKLWEKKELFNEVFNMDVSLHL